jgi:HK97 family phage major capsid protein
MTNSQIIDKADLAVSDLTGDGGYLNPIQANRFIRMLIDQPTLVNQVRVVPMNAPTMEINKIGFTSRILKVAPSSGTALAQNNRSKPTTEQVSLTTSEIMAEVHLPYDVIEDNIERGVLEDTVMAMITERASTDLEELLIQGNTSTGADAFMQLKDGVLAQATSHVVDFQDSGDRTVTKNIFKWGIKAMPNKYMRNRAKMRFYVSPDTETEYVDSITNRETNYGDAKIQRWTPSYAYGVPVYPAALMPNTNYILCDPKNIILGIQRQIMIETDRDIRARVLIIVLTMRIDIVFEEEDAIVKGTGFLPNEDEPTTTTA